MSLLGTQYNNKSRSGSRLVLGVEASTTIYLGGMVAVDANGYLVPAQPFGSNPLNALQVVGKAESVQNGIPGQNAIAVAANSVLLEVLRDICAYDNDTTISAEDIGAPCFCLDDHTVGLSDGAGASTATAEAHTIPAAPLFLKTTQSPIVASSLVVKDSTDATTYVLGTDYFIVDAANGIIGFMGATLTATTVVHLTYHYGAATRPVAGKIVQVDSDGVWVDFRTQGALAA